MNQPNKVLKYFLVALVIIIIDQASKMLVHFNMEMGTMGEIHVLGDWFRLHYLLNPGMAFGLRLENEYGKIALSLFRLVAMVGIGYYLVYLVKKGAHNGLLICMGLILGGAVGNVIDSTFYGIFLENNVMDNALMPLFHGQVIDMLFFPLFDGYYPDWIPGIGGNYFLFFSPVFNIADSSIFVGVAIILVMQKRFFISFTMEDDKKDVEQTTEA